jgi:rhodanese-related sulfurtransferase
VTAPSRTGAFRMGSLAPSVALIVFFLWFVAPHSKSSWSTLAIYLWPLTLIIVVVGWALLLGVAASGEPPSGAAGAVLFLSLGLPPLPPIGFLTTYLLGESAIQKVCLSGLLFVVPSLVLLVRRRARLRQLPRRERWATMVVVLAGPALIPIATVVTGLEIGLAGGGVLVLYPLCIGCLGVTLAWFRGGPSPTGRALTKVGRFVPPVGLVIALLVGIGHAIEDAEVGRDAIGWDLLSPEKGGILLAALLGALWFAREPADPRAGTERPMPIVFRTSGSLDRATLPLAMPIPIAGPLTSDVPVRTIERDELTRKLDAKDPRFKLVMTLGDWEFRTKHIPGSLHFKDAAEMLSTLRKDDEIVVYCTNPPCLASVAAYHRLVQEGYTSVRRYAGGIEDWENAGLQLVRGSA